MEPASTTETTLRPWISDLWRIGVIMLLALATRSWIMAHTEVVSRDSIGFIRFALQLEDPPAAPGEPFRAMTRADVLRASFHPPGYALTVLAVSWPVRELMGGVSCDAMTISAQLASVLASLLLVLPMYYLGKLVFDRQTAFVGTMLFAVLPVTSQVASDGLSDNLFLFCTVSSTWLAALGFRRDCAGWFGAAGLMSGVTYLVRPEGLIVVVAVVLVLIGGKLTGAISWRALLTRSVLLLTGVLVVAAPYVATIGRFTNKPTGDQLLHWLTGDDMKPSWLSRPQSSAPGATSDWPLAIWFDGFGEGKHPDSIWACKALIKEMVKASFYVLPLFAGIGLCVLWPRLRSDAAAALVVVLALCHSILLWKVAKGAGYVAERHTLLIVLCGCYLVAASFPLVGEKLASFGLFRRFGSASFCSSLTAVVVVGICVPSAMKPLHDSHAGHRAAGLWIASQQKPGDYVLDPFAWGEYYSGCVRLPSEANPTPHTVYILFDAKGNMHPRLHVMHVAKFFADRAQVVYRWPEDATIENAKVCVYRWDGDNFAQLWDQAYAELQQKLNTGP